MVEPFPFPEEQKPPTIRITDILLFVGLMILFSALLSMVLPAVGRFILTTLFTIPAHEIKQSLKTLTTNGYFTVSAMLLYWLVLILVLWFITVIRKIPFREAIAARPLPDYHVPFLIGLSILLVMMAITVSIVLKDFVKDTPMQAFLLSAHGLFPLFLYAGILGPIIEEVVFRGFLFGPLQQKWGTLTAGILTTIVFTGFHAMQLWGAWVALIPIALLGGIFAWLRSVRNSIFPGILVHILYNSSLFALFMLGMQLMKLQSQG